MKKSVTIICLLLCGVLSFAQDPFVSRSTKSYLIAEYNPKDTSFLQEKCRQAGLDLGISVLANRIPTNSRLVSPKPSPHLLKQGTLQLQSSIDDNQIEIAVYLSPLFDQPQNINVIQIDDELIVYRTTEASTFFHLLHHCKRGAFGTKATSHAKNAVVYKLWDTPERALLPDLEVQNQMAQAEAKRWAKTNSPLLIFNDLKSYALNELGDEAIGLFLDTMHKYNPGKLLQADLLTPSSKQYLSRVNENQYWNESMRTKIIETLTEKQVFYHENQMPWMIGNFTIHLADKNRKATSMEELEWFLSKAAAFDAGFGLDFSAEAMRKHGLTNIMLNTIKIWETLRLSQAFTDDIKETLKDPYCDWHIKRDKDSTFLLYPQHNSRRYYCNLYNDQWEWNSPYTSRFALCITVEGKGSISNPVVRTLNGILEFPCTIKAGQYLIYDFEGNACITDFNYNKIANVYALGESFLDEGISEVTFSCEVKMEERKKPEVNVRYYTHGHAKELWMRSK
ncbi:MAG: hypothetical protein IKG95_01140 [Bacteroidales bacterium]|nr:hypothetical protein [Bacteroidales bacterium]